MQAKELETELDAALIDVEDQISVESCKDHDVRRICLGRQLYGASTPSAHQFQHVFSRVFTPLALEGQDLSRMYLAHHELESVIITSCYQYHADHRNILMTTKQNEVSS